MQNSKNKYIITVILLLLFLIALILYIRSEMRIQTIEARLKETNQQLDQAKKDLQTKEWIVAAYRDTSLNTKPSDISQPAQGEDVSSMEEEDRSHYERQSSQLIANVEKEVRELEMALRDANGDRDSLENRLYKAKEKLENLQSGSDGQLRTEGITETPLAFEKRTTPNDQPIMAQPPKKETPTRDFKTPLQAQMGLKDVEQYITAAKTHYAENDTLQAIINSIRAGELLKDILIQIRAYDLPESTVSIYTRLQVVGSLHQVVYGAFARSQFKAHADRVWSIDFTRKGDMFATASADKMVKLWNLNGDLIRTFPHETAVHSVSFMPDGRTFVSGGFDHQVHLWNSDGTGREDLSGHQASIWSVDFSPDGRWFASASTDNTIRLWRTIDSQFKILSGHTAPVNCVTFSPIGNVIASGSGDRTIKLWNLGGEEIKTLTAHTASVRCVTYSRDGQLFASAGDDRSIRLWDRDGNLLDTFWGHEDGVWSVSFSPDKRMLVSVSDDLSVKIWNLEGDVLATLQNYSTSVLSVVQFSPDGTTLATANDDGLVILWDLDLDRLLILACDILEEYLQKNPWAVEQAQGVCKTVWK